MLPPWGERGGEPWRRIERERERERDSYLDLCGGVEAAGNLASETPP